MNRLFLSFLLALPLAACGDSDFKPLASGRPGEVLVIADSTTWNGPVGEAIRAEIGQPSRTLPQPEPAFDLVHQTLNDYYLDSVRRQTAVIFAAPYTDTTATARFLRARLDSAGVAALEQGGRGVILRPDLWARDQLVVYATAPSDSALAAQIRAQGGQVRDALNALARERLEDDMFEKARQVDVEEELLEEHGFTFNVQHDYLLVRDTTFQTATGDRGTFVRLRRVLTDTWRDVFVYYEDDPEIERLQPDSVLALRERLTERFVLGTSDSVFVQVEDRFPERAPIVVDTVSLGGRFALETRGLWYLGDAEGRTAGIGGPFVNYAFYDEDTGRFYMIDGMVYAPDYPKREFLRQVETIAHTFRTAPPEFEVVADREES
ncbi:MAG: DUF4837 family protein [Rhodothermales bacterium]|nr:DUF4837 family protein [Rhodothermales bacterium]